MSHPVNPGRVARTAETDKSMIILKVIGGAILTVLAFFLVAVGFANMFRNAMEAAESSDDFDNHGHE